jgi:hypothetical protein
MRYKEEDMAGIHHVLFDSIGAGKKSHTQLVTVRMSM